MINLTVEIESEQLEVQSEPNDLKWGISLNINDSEIRVYAGENPYHTFTNVDPGNYVIKASRLSDGKLIGPVIVEELSILKSFDSDSGIISNLIKRLCYK